MILFLIFFINYNNLITVTMDVEDDNNIVNDIDTQMNDIDTK